MSKDTRLTFSRLIFEKTSQNYSFKKRLNTISAKTCNHNTKSKQKSLSACKSLSSLNSQSIKQSNSFHLPKALNKLQPSTRTAGYQVMMVKRENSDKSRDKALEKGIFWEKNPDDETELYNDAGVRQWQEHLKLEA